METEKLKNHNAFFRQLLFLGALIFLGLVLIRHLQFFVGAFLGALTMYIVLRNLLFRMVDKRKWKFGIAALVLVLGMTVVLLGTGFMVFEMIASEISNIDTSKVVCTVKELPETINDAVGFVAINGKVIAKISGFLGKAASGILNSTYTFAANAFMMLLLLYFMLAYARKMEKKIFQYFPFKGKSLSMIKHEVHSMIYSNAVGIPLIMFSQGMVAALVYWLFGLNNIVFLAFITALFGLIPMFGTVIVSVPLGLYFISDGGEVWQGLLLMFCGLVIIANVDNLIRIILMGKVANTPPLIVIFGVLMGIPMFGFWGIIFGPLMIACFKLLIKIYYMEYGLIQTEEGTETEEIG